MLFNPDIQRELTQSSFLPIIDNVVVATVIPVNFSSLVKRFLHIVIFYVDARLKGRTVRDEDVQEETILAETRVRQIRR